MKHKHQKQKWKTLRAFQKPPRLHKESPKLYKLIAKAQQHFWYKI